MVTRTNVYAARTMRYVPVTIAGYSFNYAFLSNVDDSASTPLGHVLYDGSAALPAETVVGANSPKPARASKQGVSSWIASSAISNARSLGWKITRRARQRGARQYGAFPGIVPTRGATTVYVTVRGIFYAWKMPNYQILEIEATDVNELGLKVPSTDADVVKLVYGASFPLPGRAVKVFDANPTIPNDAEKEISTFYEEGANLTTWVSTSVPETVY